MITVYKRSGINLYGLYFTTDTKEMYTFTYNVKINHCHLSRETIWGKEYIDEEEYLNCLSELNKYIKTNYYHYMFMPLTY